MRYDDIYRMDEIKKYIVSYYVLSFIFVVSQNALLSVITFHHLSDCKLYSPHTTRRERETEAGGEQPARTKQGARS